MEQFIYVFEPAARDKLLAAGFLMVKADERNAMWIFATGGQLQFDLLGADFSYITSNTLTF